MLSNTICNLLCQLYYYKVVLCDLELNSLCHNHQHNLIRPSTAMLREKFFFYATQGYKTCDANINIDSSLLPNVHPVLV